MKRFISLLLVTILFIETFSFTAYASDTREYILANDIANSWRYKDGEEIEDEYAVAPINTASHPDATLQGIDVSKHQGQINWEKVKAAGIDFAIIRCGYAENKPEYDDIWWEYNASECERLNIPYGVYLYSYAESLTDALSEAEHVLRLIEGHNLSFPVFYDMEEDRMLGHDLAAMAKVFCDRISEMGYPVGVYANRSWWENYLTNVCFDNWYKWVAEWDESCKYTKKYTIWQYYNKGTVDGISTDVDMNYLIGYPDDHKGWTEKLNTPELSLSNAVSEHPLLSWNAVQWAEEYQIWRKAGNDYYSLIDTVNDTSFTDFNAISGAECSYMVKAVSMDNKTGNSYFSNAKSVIYINDCRKPSGHSYKETVISPTCTEEGYTIYTCEICQKTYTDIYTDPLGHTEVIDSEAVAPDCINTGLTESKHCSVCGEILSYQETTDALGHSFTKYTVNGDGTKTAKCDRCDETDTIPDSIYNGNINENVSWYIDINNTLHIKGNGDIPNFNNNKEEPWYDYRNQITKIVIEEGITAIGDLAFSLHENVKEVKIPSTVNKIGVKAFASCSLLAEINIPGSVKTIGINAFRNCSSLENIILENGIETIGFEAFYGCEKIQEIIIPDSVTEIGTGTFEANKKLKSVILSANIKNIAHQLFAGCESLEKIIIPEGVNFIGDNAFSGCISLIEIDIPYTLKEIGTGVFDQCTSIEKIKYNGSAQEWFDNVDNGENIIGNADISFAGDNPFAFRLNESQNSYTLIYYAGANGNISIPDSYNNLPVTRIGDNAFKNNTNITSVVIPEGVTTVGENCFNSCSELKEIVWPETFDKIGANAFAGCSSLELIKYNGSGQQWVDTLMHDDNIPRGVHIEFGIFEPAFIRLIDENGNEIDEYGLWWWEGAKGDIIVPSTFRDLPVTYILPEAFEYNNDITSVKIPENILFIGYGAFKGCSKLKEITIPISVEYIGAGAFEDCAALEKVYYPSLYNWNKGWIGFDSGNNDLVNAQLIYDTDWGFAVFEDENSNKTATIIGNENVGEIITFPAEIAGYPVKEFYYFDGFVPFENGEVIKKVFISEGIEGIDLYFFEGCTQIQEIVIPATYRYHYGDYRKGFKDVPQSVNIYVDEGSPYAYVFEIMGYDNVFMCTSLKSIKTTDKTVIMGTTTDVPSVTKYPDNAYGNLNILWSVAEDADVVEIVETDGIYQIVTKSPGTATITATDTNSGYSTTSTVNVVLPAGENMTMGLSEGEEIGGAGLETGDSRKLIVSSATAGEISADKLTFTSSNPKAITVDESGVITSVCTSATPVTVTITATLKNDAAEKAIFKVKAVTKQAAEVPVEIGTVEAVNGYNVEIVEAENNHYTVTVPYEMVKNASLSFEVSGAFDDAEFEAVGAKAPGVSWSTDNKAVASVKALSAAEGYKAQITVAKGANGTATVTVTAKDMNKASAVIEIDVRDYTPRLSTNTVTLNTYKTEGAEIKLYQAYDAEIKAEGETPAVQIKGDDRFCAEYNAETETVTVKANETVANNSKGDKVTLAVNTDKGLYEQTVTVKAANKLPSVTVNQNGVFNTFVKDSSVFAAVTAKNAQIADVQLKDTNTFAGVYNPADGGIYITYADDYEGITPDTSATLEVSFAGYRETAKVKYNISAKETKPKLVLSRSSTAFTYLSMDSEAVTVKDKATGEEFAVTADNWKVVSDSEAYATAEKAGNGIKFVPILNTNNKFANNKTSHTVKFEVQAENWVKPLTFSHTLTVNTSKPAVSTKNGTVVLRTMYESSGEMVFTANMANCPVPVFEYESTSTNAAVKAEAEKIAFVQNGWKVTAMVDTSNLPKAGTYSYRVIPTVKDTQNNEVELKAVTVKVTVSDTKPTVSIKPGTLTLNGAQIYSATAEVTSNDAVCPKPVRYIIEPDTTNAAAKAEMEKIELSYEGWQITAQFKDINDLPKNGSYRYRVKTVVPTISGEAELKTVYVVVKVNTVNPKVTLTKTGVTVNPQIGESISFEAKINTSYVIEDMQFGTANSNAAGKPEVSYSNGKVTVKAIEGSTANGTYSYSVKASVRADKDGAEAKEISVGTLKVTVKSGKATLRTTQSGSMDLVMRDKGITYTVTGGSNFNYANVDMTQVRNVNLTGADAEQFRIAEVSVNSKNQLKVHIVPKAEAQLEANRIYRYGFAVEADNMVIESSIYSVKTKQSALQIKTAGDTTVYHSRTSGQIEIGVKAPAEAKIAAVEILSTGTTVPRGAVEFTARGNGNGTYTVDYTVTKATKLKVGKTYRLALKVTPEGNATNKAPQTVYVNLAVKR